MESAAVKQVQSYLHSTMYLFKPELKRYSHWVASIYIPLCIYLNLNG